MSKQRPKQLTMNKIKNEAKQYNKTEEYIINDKGEAIRFYPVFPQGKIDEMLNELRDDLIYADEKGIELDKSDEFFIQYIMLLCVKHFTSLKDGFVDDVEGKILQFEHLKDAGYFDIIVGEVFLETEKNKVIESISKIFGTHKFMEKIEQHTQEVVQSLEFRNKEVMEQLGKNLNQDLTKDIKQ